ncbi:hypothetical protein [Hymenobacter segetis]|uniref:Uncharacterized protein n=1 Tax=Hymenobacter segetis TaxID=2025509 RepID=A0ABU9LTK1_9BACT
MNLALPPAIFFCGLLTVACFVASCGNDPKTTGSAAVSTGELSTANDSLARTNGVEVSIAPAEPIPRKKQPVPAGRQDTRIISDFVLDPFCRELHEQDIAGVMSRSASIVKSTMQNHYDDNATDTLITVTKNQSKIVFRKSPYNFLLDELFISDKRLARMCHGIDIGMPKAKFIKAICEDCTLNGYPDTIRVSNEEVDRDCRVIFRNDVLVSVRLYPY